MTHQRKRCNHCAVTYSYQGSGHGCMEPTNDPSYCPECKQVILDALASVPAKRERDWVVTTDVTVEELVKREADGVARVRAEGGLPITRVPMGLYDLRDPSNHNRGGVVRVDGKTLRYDYWTKAGMDAGVVSVEVERDAVTGDVLGPWEFTDNWYRDGVKPPTLVLDEDHHAGCPEPDPNALEGVTFEVKPFPVRPLSSIFYMEQYPLISGEGSALKDMVEINDTSFLANVEKATSTLKATRDYAGGYGRKTFLVEPLPDGALPVYEEVVPPETGSLTSAEPPPGLELQTFGYPDDYPSPPTKKDEPK